MSGLSPYFADLFAMNDSRYAPLSDSDLGDYDQQLANILTDEIGNNASKEGSKIAQDATKQKPSS